ncbi:hypothetical protein WJX73_008934 [Symbiochloris irregularis]|uniref:Uncharacterized protein n=1 Tax=Symbiochloris irregularis TaxID=706552 RepID=A0AAW1NTX6_9CHLO
MDSGIAQRGTLDLTILIDRLQALEKTNDQLQVTVQELKAARDQLFLTPESCYTMFSNGDRLQWELGKQPMVDPISCSRRPDAFHKQKGPPDPCPEQCGAEEIVEPPEPLQEKHWKAKVSSGKHRLGWRSPTTGRQCSAVTTDVASLVEDVNKEEVSGHGVFYEGLQSLSPSGGRDYEFDLAFATIDGSEMEGSEIDE